VAWLFLVLSPTINAMQPPEQTPRQRIIELITGTRLSSYQLAQMLGIPERQVEGASDPRREDHRTRQDKAVHPEPSTLSGL